MSDWRHCRRQYRHTLCCWGLSAQWRSRRLQWSNGGWCSRHGEVPEPHVAAHGAHGLAWRCSGTHGAIEWVWRHLMLCWLARCRVAWGLVPADVERALA